MKDETLTTVQFDIIDSIYFVEPYANILEEVDKPEPEVRDELKTLLDRGYVNVFTFDKDSGDYLKAPIYDLDNLQDYYFLASKDGLMKHNGM